MKILMTGSQGFIGSLLRKRFKTSGWTIVEFEGDILKPDDMKKFFHSGCGWDTVIHLAGIGSVPGCNADVTKAYEVNSTGVFVIAEAIKAYSPKAQLIFSSTGQVYDLDHGLEAPVDESHAVRPGNNYAKTKRAAELYIEDCFKSFDGNYVILRIFNHSHKSQRPEFFMPSIYQQILEKKGAGKSVVLEVGNMDVERDIGAVQDLAEAFYKIVAKNKKTQQIYNLCSGTGKSLKVIVQEMAKALEIDVTLKVIPERIRQGDPIRMIASNAKLCRDFDWKPQYASNEQQLVRSFLSDLAEGSLSHG